MKSSLLIVFMMATIGFSALSVAGEECKFCGQYKLKSDMQDSALQELWTAMGYNEENQKLLADSQQLDLQVRKEGEKYFVKTTGNKCGELDVSFESGVEFTLTLCDGRKVPTTATVYEKVISFILQDIGGIQAEHNGDSFVWRFAAKDKNAEQTFVPVIPA